MSFRKITVDRIVGSICIVIGIISLIECKRLYPMRTSFLSGDHALLGLLGVVMVALGILLLVIKQKTIKVEFPEKSMAKKMILTTGILIVYSIVITKFGYLLSTAFAGLFFFHLFGNYSWLKCAVISTITTIVLYAMFVVGLGMSLPRGLLG